MPAADHNALNLLRRSAERVPERPALIFGGGSKGSPVRRWSFGELWQRSGRFAAGLAAFPSSGLKPGDRAVVMIPMSPELYAALVAVLRLGAVAVFVDPWIGARRLAAFAAFAEPRAWLGVPRSHLLRSLDDRLRRLPVTVTTGRRLGPWPARRTLAELTVEGPGETPTVHPVSPDDAALVTFTSGSGGRPKGADRSHRFLVAQHRALAREFPYRDDDVDMPMFPVFALNNLALGLTSVVPQMDFRYADRVEPAAILRQMETFGVTTVTASPPFFDRLAAHLEAGLRPAPPLRRLLTGGAPVSDAQLQTWLRTFPGTEIQVVYGSTEAEPVAHVEANERLTAAGGPGYLMGTIVPELQRRLVRITRGPVDLARGGWPAWEAAPGEAGELVIAGEHVCRGYFRDPEATRAAKVFEPSGQVWHRMGDTGTLDAEGRFWLVGRVHSTILRRGRPVHAQLVEQAALGDRAGEGLRRVAAVGLPHPEFGEKVVLVLEVDTAVDAAGRIRERVEERLRRAGQSADEILLTRRRLPLDPRHRSKIDYPRLSRLLKTWKLRAETS
jgi:acyl-CoA synthetase (AMP-forming)/AMP-acid ligase II